MGKIARELKYKDELDLLYGRTQRRCRVLSDPIVNGDRVELKAAPVVGQFQGVSQTYHLKASALVQAHPDRVQSREPRMKLYRSLVLRYLTTGEPALSIAEIHSRISHKSRETVPYTSLCVVLRELSLEGELVVRQRSHQKFYRRPLPLHKGDFVVMNPDGDTPRYGWVDEVRFHTGTGEELPVIRWSDRTRSFASQEQIEPVLDREWRKRLQVAQQIAAGDYPADFVFLEGQLLGQLLSQNRGIWRVNRTAMLQAAKEIGLLDDFAQTLTGATYNLCIDWLDLYYPDWRTIAKAHYRPAAHLHHPYYRAS